MSLDYYTGKIYCKGVISVNYFQVLQKKSHRPAGWMGEPHRIRAREAGMIDTLKKWANDRGYRVGWGPAEVVQRARAAICDRRDSGELDTDFCRGQLGFLLEAGDGDG
jgi:hypothetical protein